MCNVNFSDITDLEELDSAFRYEITWLEQVFDSLQNDSTNDKTAGNGWAAHYVSKNEAVNIHLESTQYPPLITDKVGTLNTQDPCMLENIKCTKIINPGQTSLDWSYQPVFALKKELQFRFPKMFQN